MKVSNSQLQYKLSRSSCPGKFLGNQSHMLGKQIRQDIYMLQYCTTQILYPHRHTPHLPCLVLVRYMFFVCGLLLLHTQLNTPTRNPMRSNLRQLEQNIITWIPWTPNDAVTPQRQSQFTPKMKANAVSRLLSSLVWIDHYNQCNGMTSFMEFM